MTDSQTEPQRHWTREEVIRLGKEMYERDIRRQVEDDRRGKVISIDVETGRWAIGDSVTAATGQLFDRRIDVVSVYSVTIGDTVLHRFGGRSLGWTQKQFPSRSW